MIFLVDLDGVIRNLVSGIYLYNGAIYSPRDDDFIDEWNAELFGVPISYWINLPEVFEKALPYPYANYFVDSLSKLGKVFYCTCQHPNSWKVHIDWLKKHGFLAKSRDLILVGDQKDKIELLDSLCDAFLIDDHPNMPLNNPFFLPISRPWNEYPYYRNYWDLINHLRGGILCRG